LQHTTSGTAEELKNVQKELVYRQIAFVYTLKNLFKEIGYNPGNQRTPFFIGNKITSISKKCSDGHFAKAR